VYDTACCRIRSRLEWPCRDRGSWLVLRQCKCLAERTGANRHGCSSVGADARHDLQQVVYASVDRPSRESSYTHPANCN
jgi:hypothetical protein